MPLINCEITYILRWPSTSIVTISAGAETYAINDAKLYVSVVTLST